VTTKDKVTLLRHQARVKLEHRPLHNTMQTFGAHEFKIQSNNY